MAKVTKPESGSSAGGIPAVWRLIRALIRLTVMEAIVIALIVATAAVLITAMSLRIAGIVNAPADTPAIAETTTEASIAAAADKPDDSAGEWDPDSKPSEPAPDKPGDHTFIVVH